MDYQKFLVLFSVLLVIPIAKADGCGIVCPKGANDLLTFSLATLCNFFTWSFCHIFAFIIVAITGIVIFIFWHQQQDEKKKKIKLFLYALFGIFALVLFYPYIKAWTGAAVSITANEDVCSYNPVTSSDCVLIDIDTSKTHIPYVTTNYWNVSCPNQPIGEDVYVYKDGNLIDTYNNDKLVHLITVSTLTSGVSYLMELICPPG